MLYRFYLVLAGAMLAAYGCAMASPLVTESPIRKVYDATTVSVSTSAWTKIPTTDSDGRVGFFVSNPGTNSADMVGVMVQNAATAPATSIRPLYFPKGAGATFLPAGIEVDVYVLSLNSSAENVHVQEVRQEP